MSLSRFFCASLSLLFGLFSGAAWAGRPLTVDDANTNDTGAGHVEVWLTRDASQATVVNIAPAYAPVSGFELSALVSRDRSNHQTLAAIQVKWVISPHQDQGCNAGVVLARSQSTGSPSSTALNGLLTCNHPAWGSAHFNLGGVKSSAAAWARTWGVAMEREWGALTPHVEWFGQQGQQPTGQVGLRVQVHKYWQIDGTWGRSDHRAVYSLGVKRQF